MSEDSISEVSEQSEDKIPPQHLRELVFTACANIQISGKKVSHSLVKEQVGEVSKGDLVKLINEWKKSQSLVHHQPDHNGMTHQAPDMEDVNLNPSSQREQVTQMGAKLASEILIGEYVVASYLLQNPDKLPAEFQHKVQQARANFNASIRQHYRPEVDAQELAQLAIEALNQVNS